ncbi:MAG: helix-turn-helix transcriptional regulator [Polaribacter sp.]|jgi:transcriptional regulator with XRE-family HTH domain|nr:helix-turn-helix transcriptional regulator [Polaribacter sp.]MDG1953390.1 helix-turn-helix transcriptional regulator [Polaribacter sp.]MDG2074066.1 helix-turn-helix transcriptional regulator [Polaribacter sp.]
MNRVDKIRERIKLSRIEKGYSQDYVGARLNMSQIAYHKLENGKTQLKVEILLELANILEVKESYLLACDE